MVFCLCPCAPAAKSVGVVGPYTVTFDIGNFEIMWPQNTVTGTAPNGNGFTMYKSAFLGGYVYIVDYVNPIVFDQEADANSQFPNGPDGSSTGTIGNMPAVIAWGTSSYYPETGIDKIAILAYQVDADTKALVVVFISDQSRGTLFTNLLNTITITKLKEPTAESLDKATQALENFNIAAANNRIAVDNFRPWGAGNHEFGPGSH